jgi:hypothetical protein
MRAAAARGAFRAEANEAAHEGRITLATGHGDQGVFTTIVVVVIIIIFKK